ncbi:hypothetical protein LS72_010115 [Helicobacter apodemus]|uniref:DUF1640 domain-containing protein n=1 Tax=Helicobacter apodemus TaxID=135569 RepID=A0A4U8UBA0_9HELI|nr:hypothetical protein [Helicobacter apodemus]TLE13245.1 hypothetical protein LS72_010115 [Helicobacter apodemus]
METTMQQKEVLSYSTKLLLVEMIKKFKQEDKKDEIIDVVLAVANDIKTNDNITAKAIKDEVEEKFKNELATKEFVRAEIAEAKSELIRWVLGIGVASVLVAVSANFAMMTFFFQQLTK